LVEVIVVLVILAILAAIAIPALTGYIDKANDKKYIADARNFAMALHTLVSEGYGEGKFDSAAAATYVVSGETFNTPYPANEKKHKEWLDLGKYLFAGESNPGKAMKEALSALPGIDYTTHKNMWWSGFIGSTSADTTLLNADGFVWSAFPEGESNGTNSPMVIVTYRAERLQLADNKYNSFNYAAIPFARLVYDPNAGYEVYHLNK
ncbi:MAG: hypothetical protein LBO70_01335, partial [Clostridiales Family XIII bacterium]|nr:hypothetical protein [Clostridiales Family XIII bacterium]